MPRQTTHTSDHREVLAARASSFRRLAFLSALFEPNDSINSAKDSALEAQELAVPAANPTWRLRRVDALHPLRNRYGAKHSLAAPLFVWQPVALHAHRPGARNPSASTGAISTELTDGLARQSLAPLPAPTHPPAHAAAASAKAANNLISASHPGSGCAHVTSPSFADPPSASRAKLTNLANRPGHAPHFASGSALEAQRQWAQVGAGAACERHTPSPMQS